MIKKQKGFTLIELLVVLAIISLLATLIISNMSIARKKARDSQRRANARALAEAVELYAFDHKHEYPIKETLTAVVSRESIANDFNDQYIKDLPKATNNNDYYYISDGLGSEFAIFVQIEAKENTWFCSASGTTGEMVLTEKPLSVEECYVNGS